MQTPVSRFYSWLDVSKYIIEIICNEWTMKTIAYVSNNWCQTVCPSTCHCTCFVNSPYLLCDHPYLFLYKQAHTSLTYINDHPLLWDEILFSQVHWCMTAKNQSGCWKALHIFVNYSKWVWETCILKQRNCTIEAELLLILYQCKMAQ